MDSTLEMVVVVMAVSAAFFWAARAVWKSVNSKGVCSSCGSVEECPLAGNPAIQAELIKQGPLTNLDKCQPGAPSCRELAETLERKSPENHPESGSA